MTKNKKILLILGLIIVLSIAGFYFYISPGYVVPILMYHHIDEEGKTSSLSVSPENFTHQMDFLARHNYNVISLAEFVRAKLEKIKLPPKTVVITFDDGYEDNYTNAFALLEKHGFKASIFVIVNAIGSDGYLNYEQIDEMVSSGIIDIGSHSLNGDYLPGKSSNKLVAEIGRSKIKLQSELNRKVHFFCYPIGGFTPEIQEIVKKYGYKAACTTNRGKDQTYLNDQLFALKRIKVKDSFPNLLVFRVKLSGYYNLFRKVRKPY
jgi:peptidoglycan/xylan/chitin deacetylase (PgdA/CDA1 family)